MPIEQKQYSTQPAWTIYLSDSNGWIDVTAANAIKLYGKITAGASMGPLTCAATTINSFTATLSLDDATITAVSAFTGIVQGTVASTLLAPNYFPAGTKVLSFDSVAGTITMTNPATKSGTTVTVQANVGMATHTPASADVAAAGLFSCEVAIHWDGTNTLVTIVPNKSSANDTITIDPNLTGASE